MANIFYVKCMVILHYLGDYHLVVNHISFKYMHICTRVHTCTASWCRKLCRSHAHTKMYSHCIVDGAATRIMLALQPRGVVCGIKKFCSRPLNWQCPITCIYIQKQKRKALRRRGSMEDDLAMYIYNMKVSHPSTRTILQYTCTLVYLMIQSWTEPIYSLMSQTTPFPNAGCIASPARGREGLATVARFPWHSGMSIIIVCHMPVNRKLCTD